MNKISKFGLALLATCVSAATFSSCDDWVEPENVDLNYDTADKTDPVAYEEYLEALRDYRETDHKLVYVWFNNLGKGENINTRAQRVDELPDSIDVVVFTNPTSISDITVRDMENVREKKNMKFTYVIDFDAIKLAYLEHQAMSTEEEPFAVEFLDFLTDSTATALSYAKKNNFNGIMIGYNGKITNHMTPAEKTEYLANEKNFIGIMSDWHARNPEMDIDFIGKPQNVGDKDLINDCNVLFLSESQSANSNYGFNMALANASIEGVPADRIGMVTSYTDPNDDKIGYMADGSLCVSSLANWASGENVKACAFTNIAYDYYNATSTYQVVRKALQTLNPSNL